MAHPGEPAGSVAEDYVKAIYAHTEWQPEPITPSALAQRLGLAPSSVTEMVKKLGAAGLVSHSPYKAVVLTDAGRSLALRTVRRHRLVETWLVREHGYSWDAVHDEAEVLEHVISDRLLESIAERLGHPRHDPHGDPIPSAAGVVDVPPSVVLADASAGTRGDVVRISDRDPALLRSFDAWAVSVGSAVSVLDRGARLRVSFDGTEHDLDRDAAASVWISV